jgi:ceramide glucosyltransferase
MLIIALKLLLPGMTLAACVFYFFSRLAAVRFFSKKNAAPSSTLQPVSILIPLCGVDEGAYASYAAFCLQDYPAYQIVFGVRDPLDPAIPIVHRLMPTFPSGPLPSQCAPLPLERTRR